MQGHPHTYSWTYPLLGETGGVADFVNDTDKDYEKGPDWYKLSLAWAVGGLEAELSLSFPSMLPDSAAVPFLRPSMDSPWWT